MLHVQHKYKYHKNDMSVVTFMLFLISKLLVYMCTAASIFLAAQFSLKSVTIMEIFIA